MNEKLNGLFLYGCFLVLSLIDLFFTSIIVGEDPAKELNPVASLMLESGSGYFGLASVKLQSFVIVGACVWLISKVNPRLARFVLYFGIVVMLCVTLYHMYLLFVLISSELREAVLSLPA